MKTARVVWPNAGLEAWYRKTLQALIREMSSDVLKAVRVAYLKSPPAFGFGQDAPNDRTLLRKAMEKWGALWVKRLDRLSLSLAPKFASKSRVVTDRMVASSFRAAGLTVKFQPTPGMRKAYAAVVDENVHLIKSIPTQYLDKVQTTVYRNAMKGGDLKSMVDGIQKVYETTHKRAALIARDQNNKAKAVFEAQRRKEMGIEKAKWMHSHAGMEPRPSHVAMNGVLYDINKGLYDTQVKQFVHPGELINCRCSSKAVIEGFE